MTKRHKSDATESNEPKKDIDVPPVTPTPQRQDNEDCVKKLSQLVDEVKDVQQQLNMGEVPLDSDSSSQAKSEAQVESKEDGTEQEDSEGTAKDPPSSPPKSPEDNSNETNAIKESSNGSTLFNFGFTPTNAKDSEDKIEVVKGVKYVSSSAPIAKDYIKNNEDKLVRIGVNLVKVEDGTFDRMDANEDISDDPY